jgi:predicted permease
MNGNRLRAWMLQLSGLWPSARREQEMADELESHLAMHIDDNLRAGMTPEQARRHALLKLGGVETTKEACRERRTLPFLDHLLQDVRFAVRQLRKNPRFAATAIFILTLGIGATVAIFAFVDAALIAPLPYRDPTRLVAVTESVPMFPFANLSYLDYLDWKRMNRVFESLEAFQQNYMTLTTAAGAVDAPGARVTDGFFRTLGVAPVLGRDFYAGEDLASAPRAVLLSYNAWQERYAGRPDVLGQSVVLDGEPTVIVGVLPRDFHFAPVASPDFWVAMHAEGECAQRRSCHDLLGVARLKRGVSAAAALADVKAIASALEKQYPEFNRDQGAALVSLSDLIVGDIRPILLMLLVGAGLLLLIASVNVASLLLVRAESRQREIAVRSSLGASPARLIRQFVTEALVLLAAGSAAGLLLARWTMQFLISFIPANRLAGLPFLNGVGLNPRVLAFAAAISLFAAALFSLISSLRVVPLGSRGPLRQSLAEGGRGSAGNTWRRLGSKLVVLEIATAMVLLVGAGLLGKSLYRLLQENLGFESDHLITLQVGAPHARYGKDPQAIALEREVLGRIGRLPGVQSVGLGSMIPISNNGNTTWFHILGRPWHGEHNEAPERDVSANYFATLGARIVRGRNFREEEDASKPLVVVINQALANQYFPGEDPIGQHLSEMSTPPKPIEIIGIVENIKEGPLDVATVPAVYYPFNQSTDTFFGLVVRTSQSGAQLLPAMADTIHQFDPNIVTTGGETMSTRINRSVYQHRSAAWLVGSFAALALLLSVVGLYGVVAYSVSQRTREIGVRVALGAQRRAIYQLILQEAGWLIVAGLIVGAGCSLAAATSAQKLLFGVRSWDLPTLAAVAAILGTAALIASYVPARRAASVDPVEALRAD